MVINELEVDFFPKNYTLLRRIGKKGTFSDDQSGSRKKEVKESKGLSVDVGDTMKTESPTKLLAEISIPSSTAGYRSSLVRLSKKPSDEVPSSGFFTGECNEHGRKLELICLDHKCRICASCALFGSHKGHNYRPEEEILKEITGKAETLIDLFQNIENTQNKSLDQKLQDKISSKFRFKLSELTDQIQEKFEVSA